uniref:Uncharacterized protein n=1 Tax=Oryza punctata TaxID=4537 RepID=A0A0E0JX01_ORYPU
MSSHLGLCVPGSINHSLAAALAPGLSASDTHRRWATRTGSPTATLPTPPIPSSSATHPGRIASKKAAEIRGGWMWTGPPASLAPCDGSRGWWVGANAHATAESDRPIGFPAPAKRFNLLGGWSSFVCVVVCHREGSISVFSAAAFFIVSSSSTSSQASAAVISPWMCRGAAVRTFPSSDAAQGTGGPVPGVSSSAWAAAATCAH